MWKKTTEREHEVQKEAVDRLEMEMNEHKRQLQDSSSASPSSPRA